MKSSALTLILLLYFTKQAQFSLTFYDDDKGLSWIEAVEFCKNNGLSLASNQTEIQNWLKENDKNTEVWFGKYNELTDWAYIKGCYVINNLPIYYDVDDRLVCQKLCKTYDYFADKNGCICLQQVDSFTECMCNHPDCTTVWRHQLEVYDNQNHRNATLQCIAATSCDDEEVVRKYDLCDKNYRVICDDGTDLQHSGDNQNEKAELCHDIGSFIKWFEGNDCPEENKGQLWTSGIRKNHTFFILLIDDVIDEDMLLGCSSITVSLVHYYSGSSCEKRLLPFLCEKVVPPRLTMPNEIVQKQSLSVGVIVGSVLAVVFVTVSVIVLLLIMRQRRKKRDNAQVKSTNTKSMSNLGFNFHVTESSDIKTHKTDYDYPRVTGINNDKNVTINYNLAKPMMNEKGGDYSFAQPIDSDGDYAYNSDYDHFNNPVKTTNDSDHYTSAGQAKKIYDDKNGTYDHLSSFERKKNDEESCSNSNYDHLPNITGSDPTYDVSGDVIHDESDKYDHLPPNFNADTSSDYQSTRLFPGSVKDDAYDHFEMKE